MKKNEMTWQVMLIEAVGIVSAIAYLGLQIYYGIAFHVTVSYTHLTLPTTERV